MKPLFKVVFLTSVITASLVYVILEWRPLQEAGLVPAGAQVPVLETSAESRAAEEQSAPPDLSPDERNNFDVYTKFSPGVVNITSTTLSFDFFFRAVPETGTGSGAILDKQGNIVTNYHVIENAQRLEVTLADKSRYQAQVIGADPNNDLAVLKIDAPADTLTPIPLGSSQGLIVGQKVLAIGNPFALDRTLTTGIISSLGRSIEGGNGRIIEGIIQTDAAINPGNSGGPLLNTRGQIIGINTAILSPSNSGNIGIGFAVPADTVKRVVNDLITLGHVRRPFLGIGQGVSLAQYPGLAGVLNIDSAAGYLIFEVVEDSPAARGGIRGASRNVQAGNYMVPAGGDVILSIGDRQIETFPQIGAAIERYRPGDRVTVTVLRGNRKMEIPVTLDELRNR